MRKSTHPISQCGETISSPNTQWVQCISHNTLKNWKCRNFTVLKKSFFSPETKKGDKVFPRRSLPHKRFLMWLKIVSSPPLSNWVRKVWKLTCVPLDFQTAFAILIGLAPQSSSVVYCVHPVSWSEGIHFNTSIPFCFVKNMAEILEFPGLNCHRYVELTTIPKRIKNQPSIEMRMLWRWKTTYTLLKKPTIALKALFLQFLFTMHFSILLRTSGCH